jgi:hypothetical protein
VHGTTAESYRKTSNWLNRVRYQPQGGTPSRSLQDSSQREGSRVLAHLALKREQILQEHDFSDQGIPLVPLAPAPDSPPAPLPVDQVLAAIEHCGKTELIWQQMHTNPVRYESPVQTVNISIDDVGVKRQTDQRPAPPAESGTQRQYAYQTVVHVETHTGCYRFNAVGLRLPLSILVAFLLHNDYSNITGWFLPMAREACIQPFSTP